MGKQLSEGPRGQFFKILIFVITKTGQKSESEEDSRKIFVFVLKRTGFQKLSLQCQKITF